MCRILDIGGEGRYPDAWNLNPSPVKTIGPERGAAIPNHIPGRADAIPLPDQSVHRIIVERTPLTAAAVRELARVIAPRGEVILRHAVPPGIDPHATAREILAGRASQSASWVGGRLLQETRFVF